MFGVRGIRRPPLRGVLRESAGSGTGPRPPEFPNEPLTPNSLMLHSAFTKGPYQIRPYQSGYPASHQMERRAPPAPLARFPGGQESSIRLREGDLDLPQSSRPVLTRQVAVVGPKNIIPRSIARISRRVSGSARVPTAYGPVTIFVVAARKAIPTRKPFCPPATLKGKRISESWACAFPSAGSPRFYRCCDWHTLPILFHPPLRDFGLAIHLRSSPAEPSPES